MDQIAKGSLIWGRGGIVIRHVWFSFWLRSMNATMSIEEVAPCEALLTDDTGELANILI